MTAWLYLVVSSDAQTDSLADQDAWARSVADEKGWRITRTFSDSSSGKTGARELLEELLVALRATPKKDRPARILLTRIDRLGRGLGIEAIGALAEIRQLGVTLHTRGDGDVRLARVSDAIGPIFQSIAGAFENEAKIDRIRAGYESRRQAKVPVGNSAPYGLTRPKGRLAQFVPNDDAWIVKEIDRRYLAGQPAKEILEWLGTAAPGSWTSHNGLRRALRNPAYIQAGLRTPETAALIAALLESKPAKRGTKRKHPHEFTLVFRCGRCGEVMGEQFLNDRATNEMVPALVCTGGSRRSGLHPLFTVRISRVEGAWRSFIDTLAAPGAPERWAANETDSTIKRRRIERQLAAIDQDETRLAARRDAALDLMAEDPAARRQAVVALTSVDADVAGLRARREALLGEIAAAEAKNRDAAWLGAVLRNYRATYDALDTARRNVLNQQLVAALGSHPVVDRDRDNKYGTVRVTWPEIGAEPVLDPYRACRRPGRRSPSKRTGSVGTTLASAKS